MQACWEALQLLEQASAMVEAAGDTLVVAHLALPISLLRDRLAEKDLRQPVD